MSSNKLSAEGVDKPSEEDKSLQAQQKEIQEALKKTYFDPKILGATGGVALLSGLGFFALGIPLYAALPASLLLVSGSYLQLVAQENHRKKREINERYEKSRTQVKEPSAAQEQSRDASPAQAQGNVKQVPIYTEKEYKRKNSNASSEIAR